MIDSLIALLDVIIWPSTVLIFIYWFRKPFRVVFSRLNNIDASATGISMSFSEKVSAAKKKAETLINSTAQSKGGISINPGIKDEITNMKNKLESEMNAIAAGKGIDVQGLDIVKTTEVLKKKGIVNIEKANLIHAFLDISGSAHEHIPNDEMEDIKMIYKTIISNN